MTYALTNQQIAQIMRLIARQAELALDINNFAANLNMEAARREANVITTYVSTKAHGGAQQEPPADKWGQCNEIKRAKNEPYPRTCGICKFGPCAWAQTNVLEAGSGPPPKPGTVTEVPVGTNLKDAIPAPDFQREAIERLRRAPNGTIDDQLWVIGMGPKIAALIECAYGKVKP